MFLTSADVTYGGDRYKTFDPHNNEDSTTTGKP